MKQESPHSAKSETRQGTQRPEGHRCLRLCAESGRGGGFRSMVSFLVASRVQLKAVVLARHCFSNDVTLGVSAAGMTRVICL